LLELRKARAKGNYDYRKTSSRFLPDRKIENLKPL